MKINSQFLGGFVSGIILLPSIFYPVLILISVASILLTSKFIISKDRLIIVLLFVGFVLLSILKLVSLSFDSYEIVIQIFSPLVLITFLIVKVNEKHIDGLKYGVYLIFILDLIFNVWSFIYGHDFLGRQFSVREDGNRFGGLVAHSFYSTSISLVFLMLVFQKRQPFYLVIFGLINLYFSGTFRGFGHVLFLFIALVYLQRLNWRNQIVLVIAYSSLIILATVLSVMFDYLPDKSGNYYRIFAWSNSIEIIKDSPMLGIDKKFEKWDVMGVSHEAIERTGTTESVLLGNLVIYGAPITLLKILAIILMIFVLNKKSGGRRSGTLPPIIQYVPLFILLDFIVFSLWGGMYISFVVALLFSFGINTAKGASRIEYRPNSYNNNYIRSV